MSVTIKDSKFKLNPCSSLIINLNASGRELGSKGVVFNKYSCKLLRESKSSDLEVKVL